MTEEFLIYFLLDLLVRLVNAGGAWTRTCCLSTTDIVYECEVDAVKLKCSPSMLCEIDGTLQLAATASRFALALESASLQLTGHIA